MRQSKAFRSRAWLILIIVLGLCIFVSRSSGTDDVLLSVEPPTQTVGLGEIFNVSIQIDIPPPGGVGFEVQLGWDPSVLTGINTTEELFQSVTPESEQGNIWKLMDQINNTAGMMWYAYTYMDLTGATEGGYAPISGDHTLVTITFQGESTGYSFLKFLVIKLVDLDYNPIPYTSVNGSVVVGHPPPAITVISPQNTTAYSTASVNLTIGLNEPVSWIGYSLDGQANVTVTGDVISVPDGQYTLVVYANDTTGFMGSSSTVYFTVDTTPPIALFTHSPETPEAKLVFGNFRWEFNFSGSTSYDNVSGIASYFWDFGDGTNATGITVVHVYRNSGAYDVKLTVTNNAGLSATQTEKISLNLAAGLDIPLGLVAATVIPVVWLPGLWFYLKRMRGRRKKAI